MVIEMLKHWEVAVDGLQIFLCILILIFLIRNHRRRLKPDLMNSNSESGQDFNLEVFSHAINQQVELAFANILQVATRERRNLDKVMQIQQVKHLNPGFPGSMPSSPPPHRDDSFQSKVEIAGQNDRQTHIQKMATRGLSAKQISDELKAPLGEVELILSIQKHRQN